MASNPHSDFTTHNSTLPTFSNLPLFATFCRYMNVPIASAQDHRGSPEPCDITQVPLVVMKVSTVLTR